MFSLPLHRSELGGEECRSLLTESSLLENLTWREAQGVCEDLGGYLAEIKSQEIQTLMVDILYYSDVIVGNEIFLCRKVLPCWRRNS